MAKKTELPNGVKELKIGKTFREGEGGSFHTFKYDFVPASLDMKKAILDVGENDQVTLTVPHSEGSSTASTVFKGSRKKYQKECVLIIDHETGEVTLEKLNYNVQFKKTRAEGSSLSRCSIPAETKFSTKKSPQTLSPQRKTQSIVGRSPLVQKCSPLYKSPVRSQPSPSGNSNLSRPCFNPIFKVPVFSKTPTVQKKMIDAPKVNFLSDFRSRGFSGGELSDDSSSSDNEEITEVLKQQSSASRSSRCISRTTSKNRRMPIANSFARMLRFSQLNEDLKLSESDSDD